MEYNLQNQDNDTYMEDEIGKLIYGIRNLEHLEAVQATDRLLENISALKSVFVHASSHGQLKCARDSETADLIAEDIREFLSQLEQRFIDLSNFGGSLARGFKFLDELETTVDQVNQRIVASEQEFETLKQRVIPKLGMKEPNDGLLSSLGKYAKQWKPNTHWLENLVTSTTLPSVSKGHIDG